MIEPFLCIPQKFKELCTIYPPTINQVLREETKQLINILTISQEELEDYFIDKVDKNGKPIRPPDPFTYIMGSSQYNKDFEKKVLDSFELYLHEPVSLQYAAGSIVIGNLEKEFLKISSIENMMNEFSVFKVSE